MKYIGHLDLIRLFRRTFNKAGIDIKYSQGFNPHPKFSIANPLSLGIESEEEYMDIELNTEIPLEDFIEKMNKALPTGIDIIRGKYVDTKDSIASLIAWALYEITFKTNTVWNEEKLSKNLDEYLSKREIYIWKKRKKKKKKIEIKVDVRSLIRDVSIKNIEGDKITLNALLRSGDDGNLKPIQLIDSLNIEENIDVDMDSVNIKRMGLYAEKREEIYKPI